MRLRYLFSLFLFMVFIPVTVPASASVPDYFFFTSFRSDAGLPHQQVSAMAFDHDGMLWAGTRNGLTKFDGYEFRNYYHSGNDESSIPHNFINTIFVDSDNNVWIGCEKEICRYDRSKDNFRRYRVDGQRIFHIDQLPDGSIICTGEKVFILPKGEDSFHYMSRQAESYVAGLAVSADNRIYIATNQAIVCYNRQMTMEQSVDSSIYSDFLQGFDAIVPLFFDHLGRLWIGRDGKGVMMAELKSGERKVFDYPVLTDGIVRCIAEDSGGCIWLGTEKGINVIDPASGEISSVTRDTFTGGRLSDNAVYDICFDSDDNIWVATYFGGINMMKREAGRFRRITGINGGNSDGKVVRRIIEPTAGNLWMASEDGGI